MKIVVDKVSLCKLYRQGSWRLFEPPTKRMEYQDEANRIIFVHEDEALRILCFPLFFKPMKMEVKYLLHKEMSHSSLNSRKIFLLGLFEIISCSIVGGEMSAWKWWWLSRIALRPIKPVQYFYSNNSWDTWFHIPLVQPWHYCHKTMLHLQVT